MKRRRVSSTFIAAAAICCISVTSVFADPDEDVERLQTQVHEAEQEVDSLQKELAELIIKISDLEKELIDKGEQVIKSQKELKIAEKKERKQYADMKLRIKYLYESGDDSALAMILSAGSMSDMLSRAEYGEKIHRYDRDMLTEYGTTVSEVKDLRDSLKREIKGLEDKQVEFEARKDEFDQAIEDKEAEVQDLDAQLQEAIRIAEEERRRREEEERRRREAEEQRRREEEARAAREREQRRIEYYGDSSAAEIIVQAAWSQIGVPYVWGGNTPYVGLDCSGLTKWCHAQAGINIPRYSEDQRWGGTVVDDPLPGDICWKPGHVAIYIGNGQMIEAQQTGTTICVSPVRVTEYVRWW